jgi:NTP pyrophosphatase (non-canonical NTP hydrolase)
MTTKQTRTVFPEKLVQQIRAVRDANKWNPTEVRNLPARLMSIVSELDELESALEVSFSGADTAEELSDVVIYLLCVLTDLSPDWRLWLSELWPPSEYEKLVCLCQRPGELTRPVRHEVVVAMQNWRRLQPDSTFYHSNMIESLEAALGESMRLALALGIDLEFSIEAKLRVLQKRGPTHGGKHPDT